MSGLTPRSAKAFCGKHPNGGHFHFRLGNRARRVAETMLIERGDPHQPSTVDPSPVTQRNKPCPATTRFQQSLRSSKNTLCRVGGIYAPTQQKTTALITFPMETMLFFPAVASSNRVYDSQRLQMGVYMLLVEEHFGVRPPHAVVVLGDGRRERVANSGKLRQRVLEIAERIREGRCHLHIPQPAMGSPAKCRECGQRANCEQRVDFK